MSERRGPQSTSRPEHGYWRSLADLARDPALIEARGHEFAPGASDEPDETGRRDFLKLMGASMALAGVSGCTRQPVEKIVPYVRAPEEMIAGRPLYFATASVVAGVARGILVESHMGRPTKVEGNPESSSSIGATDVFAQASVLGLYDPDRSKTLTHLGEIRPWGAFLGALQPALEAQRALAGKGLRILTGNVTSPTLAGQLGALRETYPLARWHQYEPVSCDAARAASVLMFGESLDVHYDLEPADVIVSLDADFFSWEGGNLRYIRQFAARRRAGGHDGHGGHGQEHNMNRLYVVEPSPSNTGASADHRLPLAGSEIEGLARALAARLGVEGSDPGGPPGAGARAWLEAVAEDLGAHPGRSLVIAGIGQPAAVHALAHAINHKLGNFGKTVMLTDSVAARPVQHGETLAELVAAMDAGEVDLLLVTGVNPVYSAPADLDFAAAMGKVAVRLHHGLYHDETAELCHWHVPATHPLEEWSDARAFDGTTIILQPLIAPLYGGKSIHELVAVAAGRPNAEGYELVRGHWQSRRPGGGFNRFFERALHDGAIAGSALPVREVAITGSIPPPSPPAGSGLELVFRPDASVFDGSFANNGWLQELPRPHTRLTWDNAALMSPATAAELGIPEAKQVPFGSEAEVVELTIGGRTVRAPAWVVPGHADGSVTVHLGYGRRRSGRAGDGAGFNAYALRTLASPWLARGLKVVRTGEVVTLACTQHHHMIDDQVALTERALVRQAPIAEYLAHPDMIHEMAHDPPRSLTLYPEHEHDGPAWGMSIDLSACVGCNACVVACQAENNIPVVGRVEVGRGREMHWLRIDRYYTGTPENPETHQQPVACMHCENAPCEVVCPVNATVHSDEGLNEQVYNRCVGTRYCSNNCPYKVRRFNFFQYADFETPSLKLLNNPDVTVRTRGVMEKCSYCVQRISHARIQSKLEDRTLADGDIVTACEQACPAAAIAFGNIKDPNSRVARAKAEHRNYGMLADLNTRPRTSFLAALKNPNPKLGEKA